MFTSMATGPGTSGCGINNFMNGYWLEDPWRWGKATWTAGGTIIFFPVPAVSEPEEINCGRSYFQEKASEGVAGVYVKENRGSLNLTIKPAFDT